MHYAPDALCTMCLVLQDTVLPDRGKRDVHSIALKLQSMNQCITGYHQPSGICCSPTEHCVVTSLCIALKLYGGYKDHGGGALQ